MALPGMCDHHPKHAPGPLGPQILGAKGRVGLVLWDFKVKTTMMVKLLHQVPGSFHGLRAGGELVVMEAGGRRGGTTWARSTILCFSWEGQGAALIGDELLHGVWCCGSCRCAK